MVVKQELSQRCVCGQAIEFPDAQVKVACQCGAVWILSFESFWSIKGVPLAKKFTQSAAVAVAVAVVQLRADEYPRYPRSRKRRKAGKGC